MTMFCVYLRRIVTEGKKEGKKHQKQTKAIKRMHLKKNI